MSKIKLSETFIKERVKLALAEDLFPNGDITSNLIKNDKIITTRILSNQKAIIGGLNFVKYTFSQEIFYILLLEMLLMKITLGLTIRIWMHTLPDK